LAVLGALFAREAQAFYNPSTGRWLTRAGSANIAVQLCKVIAESRTAVQRMRIKR